MDDPAKTQNQPTDVTLKPVVEEVVPPLPDSSPFANTPTPPVTAPAAPTNESILAPDTPLTDSVLGSTPPPPADPDNLKPKKKINKKIVAGLVTILFLTIGTVAGVYYVKQGQQTETSQAAAQCHNSGYCYPTTFIDWDAAGETRSAALANRGVQYMAGCTNDGIPYATTGLCPGCPNLSPPAADSADVCVSATCSDCGNPTVICRSGEPYVPPTAPPTSPPTTPPTSPPTSPTPTSTPTPTPLVCNSPCTISPSGGDECVADLGTSYYCRTDLGGSTTDSGLCRLVSSPNSETCIPDDISTICICTDIRAYDTDWNLLTINELSSLTPGSQVYFTTRGQIANTLTGTQQIQKARFSINNQAATETTDTKPGSNQEFYILYTIPEFTGTQTFRISAELYHPDPEIGWF